MKVELISYSQGPWTNVLGVDVPTKTNLLEQVAYAARVSNPANQNNNDTAEKLVRYLIKNQHWSPLEMVSVCLEIETTRDIARQILRHRSFSFQEFSQRYAEVNTEFELREARLQDNKNRQNSVETDNENIHDQWAYAQAAVEEQVKKAYEWAINNGIAKEQARAVLPEGMTKSKMYMNGTLRSWVHYIQLRSANGTQKEHREVALACVDAIEPIFPMIREFISE
jgi:thymidylate synthase (FAD)